MIKRFLILTAALASLAGVADGQISVLPSGAGPFTFDTAPTSPADWATLTIAGAGNTYLTPAALQAAAVALNQNAITTALGSSATTPPSANAITRYNTALQFIQSRPTGNAATITKATLRNDTGGNVSALTVAYDFGVQSPLALETPGFYAYWSLSGEPNSWTLIEAFSGHETAGSVSATLPIGSWASGSLLYLMWADDNGDTASDPSYSIDNISFIPSSGNEIHLTGPANGSSYPVGFGIPLTATAIMPNPVTSVSFFDNGTLIGADTTSPYSISWSTGTIGNHTITARSTDGVTTITSSETVIITIHANNAPIITAISNNIAATHELVGTLLTYTAVVTDDGSVTNVEFKVDGTTRWNDRTSPYTFAWGDLTAGTHTLTVIASDNGA